MELHGNIKVLETQVLEPSYTGTMFAQCPSKNPVTKPYWTGANTSLFNAKFHYSGSCYWMALVNWGTGKRAPFPLILFFFLDWFIQTIASLFNWTCRENRRSTDLVFVVVVVALIRLLPVVPRTKCHKTCNFYIFQNSFYKLIGLFSVIRSEKIYWAKLKICVMALVWRTLMSWK